MRQMPTVEPESKVRSSTLLLPCAPNFFLWDTSMHDTLWLVRQVLTNHPKYAGIRRLRSSFFKAMNHMYAAIISEDLPDDYERMVREVAAAEELTNILGLGAPPLDFEIVVFQLYNITSKKHTLRPFEFFMEETPRRVYEHAWVSEVLVPQDDFDPRVVASEF